MVSVPSTTRIPTTIAEAKTTTTTTTTPHPVLRPFSSLAPAPAQTQRVAPVRRETKPFAQKNTTRERMQAELAALRVHVVRLEKELAYLKQLGDNDDDEWMARNGSSRRVTGNGMGWPGGRWRVIAGRQRLHRIHAEIRNRRLRSVVAQHVAEWNTLRDVVDVRCHGIVDTITLTHQDR